ncbi:unnamed protein product [Anisakis simplex]|uniref:Probable citrate synthase, mitochondrial (inferred by orthology to a C. elegans protein) n=1 Tax=Anisakis simplex TaxID=6269 RepID=A0A0M3J9Y4_ANISI|nr:unnamed protein product [Anisakis simplex]
MVTETSVLDPEEGIRFRGYSIPECQRLLPKLPGGDEPLPEGIWWLLCTGDIPNEQQTKAVSTAVEVRIVTHVKTHRIQFNSREWAAKADLPEHIEKMIRNFPSKVHPMAQFVSTIAALSSESKFAVVSILV